MTADSAQDRDCARLLENYPVGFALDADHTPHITLLQRYVRRVDLAQVQAAVAKVLQRTIPCGSRCKPPAVTRCPYQKLGLAGIIVAPTPVLLGL
ncbi:MAG: hypothetical protein ACKN9T_06960 [Candidatus Methylumidiphilus sp.]